MDSIIEELDNRIFEAQDENQTFEVACLNKLKMDYFLMLTIAATWDLKQSSASETEIKKVLECLQRPETGKMIKLISKEWRLDQSITEIFDLYKEGRNLRFGHTTFDKYEAERLNSECKACWDALLQLHHLTDSDSEMIRSIYQEDNSFFYVSRIDPMGEIRVRQMGARNRVLKFSMLELKARLCNKHNEIAKGDLYLSIDDEYIKISPFIQYDPANKIFSMLMDIETSPLAFKMAYIYRTEYANDSFIYPDEFPKELRSFFPNEQSKCGKNGVQLNRFSQYDLFEQAYYNGIHQEIQTQLDTFITGNMAYGAVRGVGGVGKTSAVFMWINRIINNEGGVLDKIRQKFNLRRIIFLSAKTKIYSRNVNAETLSYFFDIDSDVTCYEDIIEYFYGIFHPKEKSGITFDEKVDYIRNYSNNAHGILIIIDDYESLPKKSRKKIQTLKDDLAPGVIKMLITTRFASKESKDIIVEKLNEFDSSKMTDYIFASTDWRMDITSREMHQLTDGLPLLIWYAKAFFQRGQLSSQRLKSDFSGPAKGLAGYLYDNFIQCFEDQFTKNFLMIVTRYYELHDILQISKRTAIFLSIENPNEYKPEDEEFYFQELRDLTLINFTKSSIYIDFSPLMTYMDKTTKRQEASETYLEDNLKILAQLDEKNYQDLYAVIESSDYLENETKWRILNRIIEFARNDEAVRAAAIRKLFAISSNKMSVYKKNMKSFQTNPYLINAMQNYLLEDPFVIQEYYNKIRDFVYSVSVTMEFLDSDVIIAANSIALIVLMLRFSLNEREEERITNLDLEKRAHTLTELATKYLQGNHDSDKVTAQKDRLNELLDDVSIYCSSVSII